MEVFSQKTRDALYGSYFVYAKPGKEPDMLRVVNFTPNGVQFGRVVMKITAINEHCFYSEPDHAAGLLLIPGSKHITVTTEYPESGAELYTYVDAKTGNKYIKQSPTAFSAWQWSAESTPTPKVKPAPGTRAASAAKPKAEKQGSAKKRAVASAAVAGSEEVKLATKGEQQPSNQQQPQKKPRAAPRSAASSPSRSSAKPAAAHSSMQELLDEAAPEMSQFLDDLREEDEDANEDNDQ
jgi:hypothetical protein